MKKLVVVAPKGALDALQPLLNRYQQNFNLTVVDSGNSLPDMQTLAILSEKQDALFVIGNRRFSPRSVLSGPFIERKDGELIPASWLPYTSDEAIRRFSESAADVHRRNPLDTHPVAVLGQWNAKYLNLASRISFLLSQVQSLSVLHWTCDQLIREDMISGLGNGLAMAIYVGHGRPIGWVGYHGTRVHHFSGHPAKPLGALFSLCCETASRKRNGLSFSEAIPLLGRAACSFGAVNKSLHMDNIRWANGICSAIHLGKKTIGEIVKAAAPLSKTSLSGYRIMGDPMAPLYADASAYAVSQKLVEYI